MRYLPLSPPRYIVLLENVIFYLLHWFEVHPAISSPLYSVSNASLTYLGALTEFGCDDTNDFGGLGLG
jgi:hypothetical protein